MIVTPPRQDEMQQTSVPRWVVKLVRRCLALPDGRWQIVLTVDGREHDWTVTELGKVERP